MHIYVFCIFFFCVLLLLVLRSEIILSYLYILDPTSTLVKHAMLCYYVVVFNSSDVKCFIRQRKLADKIGAAGFYVAVPEFLYGDPYVPDSGKSIPEWIKDHGTVGSGY